MKVQRLWSGSATFGTFLLLEKNTPKECLKLCFSWGTGERALMPTTSNGLSSFSSAEPETNRESNITTTISVCNSRSCRNRDG
ncbi:hypothetical protein V6N13_001468 [Hibiscus sabdariffa]